MYKFKILIPKSSFPNVKDYDSQSSRACVTERHKNNERGIDYLNHLKTRDFNEAHVIIIFKTGFSRKLKFYAFEISKHFLKTAAPHEISFCLNSDCPIPKKIDRLQTIPNTKHRNLINLGLSLKKQKLFLPWNVEVIFYMMFFKPD